MMKTNKFIDLATDEELDERKINEYDQWIIKEFVNLFEGKSESKNLIRNVLYDYVALRESYKQWGQYEY